MELSVRLFFVPIPILEFRLTIFNYRSIRYPSLFLWHQF